MEWWYSGKFIVIFPGIIKWRNNRNHNTGTTGISGTTGIIGSETDIARRKKIFGENKVTLPTITSFLEQFAKQFEDGNIILLIIAATVYLALSVFAS